MTASPRPPEHNGSAKDVAQAAADAVRALKRVTTDLTDPHAVSGIARHAETMTLALSSIAENLASLMAESAAQEETRTFHPGVGPGPETSAQRAARKFLSAAGKLLDVSLDLTTAQRDSTTLRDGAPGPTQPGRPASAPPSDGPAL
jgi:hypothetical protein